MAEAKRKPGRPPGSKNKNSASGRKTSNSKNTESKAKARAKEIQAERKADRRVIDEIWSIIAIAIGIFLIIATFTGSAGEVGTAIGNTLKGILGFIAYVLPFYIIIYGVLLFAKKTVHISFKSTALVFAILAMLTVMNSIRFVDAAALELSLENIKDFYITGVELKSGGFVGMILATLLIKWFGDAGCWIFALTVLFACLLLLINTPVSRFISKILDKREERRLIKENAHLDILSEEKEDLQVSMSSYMAKKKPQKVLNSSVITGPVKNSSNEAARESIDNVAGQTDLVVHIAGNDAVTEEPAIAKREYIPPSQIEPLSPEKKNSILKYMEDDSLFDRQNRRDGSVGLEEKVDFGSGYGLDGSKPVEKEEPKKFGFGFNFSKKQVEMDIKTPPKETGLESSFDMSRNQQLESQSAGTKFVSKSQVGEKASDTEGTPAGKLPEKLSNKEAREAMLTVEELNQAKKPAKVYKMPSSNLLTKAVGGARTSENVLRAKAMKLEETLRNFHVDAKVVQVTQGPTVTRYEIQPAVGVKVSSIVRLSDDIALNLEAKSIRMEAPIPGKAAVGIEVENDAVTMVKLREIIDSKEFKNARSKISFAVGKDISGNAIVGDLKDMPHLLIAGSTGSGKSVCINSIILSLLYKATPDEVKLILIDPKVVELGNYNGIPHLMIPVVTDPTKAAAALNWAVAEMTDRYKKFAEAGVRDLASYNESVRADEEDEKVLPQIVIIIDELADLMMAAPSQIEDSICRLAQMARAAGMHLIVATQRPSVDVITGVIKANIPSRIAFAVSSQVDSRTILDMQGAEKLVGKGDMLFNPQGMGKPVRVQGAFVSDSEVRDVIQFVKSQVEDTSYNEEILTRIEKTSSQGPDDDADELLPEAIDLVVRSGQASVSMLQRRFRIGYNRAARIVDMMEARGIIGPQDGSRPRQVLMSEAELEEMENFQE